LRHMQDSKFYPEAKIICACGNVIRAEATVKEIPVELCSACHPFSTGKQPDIEPEKPA